jgi:hypothetical protein
MKEDTTSQGPQEESARVKFTLYDACILGTIFGLTALFIGLKYSGVIDWPWWVVFSPMWGSIALLLVIALSIILLYFFLLYRKRYIRRKRVRNAMKRV